MSKGGNISPLLIEKGMQVMAIPRKPVKTGVTRVGRPSSIRISLTIDVPKDIVIEAIVVFVLFSRLLS